MLRNSPEPELNMDASVGVAVVDLDGYDHRLRAWMPSGGEELEVDRTLVSLGS